MSNKNDNFKEKLKRLKNMYLIVGGLTGLFTLLVLSFFVIIIISTSSKTATNENPEPVYVAQITPTTEVFVNEVCVNTGQKYENQEMIQEIMGLQNPTRQGLNTYLISKNKSIDTIKLFTSNRVVIEYEVENCEICLDDSLYMAVESSRLIFYQGIPMKDNEIGSIEDEVIIITEDMDQRQLLKDGIRLEDHNLYLGIHTAMTLAVYSGEPSDVKPPLFIFPGLKVRADLITFLQEEESFHSMEELLDLIESYGR